MSMYMKDHLRGKQNWNSLGEVEYEDYWVNERVETALKRWAFLDNPWCTATWKEKTKI